MAHRYIQRRLRCIVRHPLTIVIMFAFVIGIAVNLLFLSAPSSNDVSLAETLSASVVILGIQWHGESGRRIHWIGSGFLLEGHKHGVTAGHVINELVKQSNSLQDRDLQPVFVCGTNDGAIHEIIALRVHPGVSSRTSDETMPSVDDLGVFRWRSDLRFKGLKLARQKIKAGQAIVVAGFPTATKTLQYPEADGRPLVPTVKFGHVERMIADPQSGGVELIQHGIPLMGGFSGSPVVNRYGEVVGIVNTSTHVSLSSLQADRGTTAQAERVRILDPGDINFAVPVQRLQAWIEN